MSSISQRPPAKQVAWIFGHRPKRQKSTPVILASNWLSRLGRDAKHAACMARIKLKKHGAELIAAAIGQQLLKASRLEAAPS